MPVKTRYSDGLLAGLILGIIGVVLSEDKAMAIIGIVLSVAGTVIGMAIGLAMWLI